MPYLTSTEHANLQCYLDDRDATIAALRAEVEELKSDVVAFCAPWAVQYGMQAGWPMNTLHPDHYDLLERCGARMVDFTRAALGDARKVSGK